MSRHATTSVAQSSADVPLCLIRPSRTCCWHWAFWEQASGRNGDVTTQLRPLDIKRPEVRGYRTIEAIDSISNGLYSLSHSRI